MPRNSSKSKGRKSPATDADDEELKRSFEAMLSAKDSLGADFCEANRQQDGLTKMMEERIKNIKGGEKDKFSDAIIEERELQRKAEMELQSKLQLVSTGRYVSPAPYDDGDQTPLKGHRLRILKNQWGGGMDYNALEPRMTHLSDWLRCLFKGDHSAMMRKVKKTEEKDLKNLLEGRESLMNVSAIFHVVIGARTLLGDHPEFESFRRRVNVAKCEHMKCFRELLQLGARADAKDVAGYTPLHHCLTKFFNTTTLEMAKTLLKRGVDVNVKNRFGATALMEATMCGNLEVIQLLVKFGADPSMADNDGVTCDSLARLYPKIQALFGKSNKVRAKAMREEAKAEAGGNLRACAKCGEGDDNKRCTGCYIVWYCGAPCQRSDWDRHKSQCKATQSLYIPVKLQREGVTTMKNFASGEIFVTRATDRPAKKHFLVKVQVPMSDMPGPLQVYNKERTCFGMVPADEKAYDKLKENVKKCGLSGLKAFFYALWDPKTDELKINTTDVQPMEKW